MSAWWTRLENAWNLAGSVDSFQFELKSSWTPIWRPKPNGFSTSPMGLDVVGLKSTLKFDFSQMEIKRTNVGASRARLRLWW